MKNQRYSMAGRVISQSSHRGTMIYLQEPKQINLHGKRYEVGKLYVTNGAKECARRRRQIEAGSLRAQNGLVLS